MRPATPSRPYRPEWTDSNGRVEPVQPPRVEFEAGSSLFDLLHLQDELSGFLGCDVDVVSSGGLKDRDDHIRREAVRL